MKERRQAEKARLESLVRISRYQANTVRDLLDYALDEIIPLTSSEIGFLYFYNETTSLFANRSGSGSVMDACKIKEPPHVYDLDAAGFWGEAVRQASPMVINDYSAPHPLKKGYPEGHAPIRRFMTVPVFSQGTLVAALGLANKKDPYTDADVHQMTLMVNAVWPIVQCKWREDELARQYQQRLQDAAFHQARDVELRRYRDFIEQISDGCFEVDLNGNITFLNEAMEKSLGYSRRELLDLNHLSFSHQDETRKISDIFRRVRETGQPGCVDDYELRDVEGNVRYLTISISPMGGANGSPAGYRCTARDNTEKKKAQNALEKSEVRYRNLFQFNKAIILLVDPETGMIVDANLAACYYYQYSREELLCRKMMDLTALTKEEMKEEIARAGREERVYYYSEHRLAGGEVRPVEVFSGPVEIGGKQLLYSIIHDIAERRKAEQALRGSEEKYRSILETISEGYMEYDLAGNIVYANKAACAMICCRSEQMKYLNFRDVVSAETGKAMLDIHKEIYKTGMPQTMMDCEVNRLDGGRILVELSSMLIRNSLGMPAGFRVMARDVTRRRRAEEALRRSEEKYRSILENISEGYYENDLAGNFVFANDSGCAMLGYDKEALYKSNYREHSTPASRKKLETAYHDVFMTGQYSRVDDYEFIRKDGSIRIHQLSVGLICNAAGQPAGFRTVARDVTQMRRAEESRRRSEEKYRSIMENIMEGYFEHDLAGNFTFVNDVACTMMGYPREELLKMNYKKIVSPRMAKAMEKITAEIIATGAPQKLVDYEVIRKDQTLRVHQHNISALRDESGKITGLRVMGRDVTELKWAEEALRRSEERIRLLFRNIPIPTFVWKSQFDQCVLSEFNGAALHFIGDKIIDGLGKPAEQFFAAMPQVAADIRKCMQIGENVEHQLWYSFNDRAEKKYVIIKYAFAPPDSVLMHIEDITGQKMAEENLEFISIHDSLTGLFNRFYSDAEVIRLASSRLRPVSIIAIDLNNLKKVNDEFGHAVGDLYIKNSAEILKQSFRPEDMIARIGGDEFLVLLPLVDKATCAEAVLRLNESIRLFNRQGEYPVSLSVGFATTEAGDNMMERIREADENMYVDKAAYKASLAPPVCH